LLGRYASHGQANFDLDRVTRLLGQGTFGKVVEAYDKINRTKCAIKIIRSVQKYRDASRIELRVLSTLSSNDKENRNKCIHLRDCFDYRNHICIVTDLLGMSVFDFLKSNSFVPFPSSQIQSFARQLLTSVACMPLAPFDDDILLTSRTNIGYSSSRFELDPYRPEAREYLTG
jgi:serine/threonine protein kinase